MLERYGNTPAQIYIEASYVGCEDHHLIIIVARVYGMGLNRSD